MFRVPLFLRDSVAGRACRFAWLLIFSYSGYLRILLAYTNVLKSVPFTYIKFAVFFSNIVPCPIVRQRAGVGVTICVMELGCFFLSNFQVLSCGLCVVVCFVVPRISDNDAFMFHYLYDFPFVSLCLLS